MERSKPRPSKRDVLLSFIEAYRSLPELWDTENRFYSNRLKKAQSYDTLVEKLKLIEPEANRESVVKKINNLRSAFRKELKKVDDSKRRGNSLEDLYVPSLWYYNDLRFLVDQETLEKPSGPSCEDEEYTDVESKDVLNNGKDTRNTEEPGCRKRKLAKEDQDQSQFIAKCIEVLNGKLGDGEAFGQYIGRKLEKVVDPEQRMFAESLITKVLNKALMNRLTENTDVIDPTPSSCTSPFQTSICSGILSYSSDSNDSNLSHNNEIPP